MSGNYRLIIVAYIYCALQVGAWWIAGTSNNNESWFPLLVGAMWTVFLPLNLPTLGICRLAWGSLSIFEAEPIIGLFPDIVVASVVSTTATLAVLLYLRRAHA